MNASLISVRYAQAFFQLGKDKPELLDSLHKDCKFLLASIYGSKGFEDFLSNAIIKPGEKKRALADVLENQLHQLTLNLFNIIIDNNREAFIKNILLDFTEFYRKHNGIKTITIITAFPLKDAFRDKIRKLIEDKYHCQVELECKVNDEIIGGMILMIDGRMVDSSVTGQLRAMKKQMMIN